MKKILAGLTSLIIALGLVTVAASPAQAHTPSVTSTCSTLTLHLASYASSPSEDNTVSVWIDDVLTTDATFDATFDAVHPFSDSTVEHTWRVEVVAFDDEAYNFEAIGTSTPCVTAPTATPAPPIFSSSACTGPGTSNTASLTIVEAEHISYFVSIDGGTEVPTPGGTYPIASGASVVVRAGADAGYVIDPANAGPWSHSYQPVGDCLVGATAAPATATGESCDELGSLVGGFIRIPTSDHVAYFIDDVAVLAGDHSGVSGDYLVTAQPDASYFLTNYPPEGWTLTIEADEACGDLSVLPLVVPLTAIAQLGCGTDGSLSLSNDLLIADAIVWTVDGVTSSQGTFAITDPGTVVVSAAPFGPEYGFAVDTRSQWSFEFSLPPACANGQLGVDLDTLALPGADLDTLAFTGSNPATGVLAMAALLLMLCGAILTAEQRIRVRRS